ncbi:group-specific protein [Niallia circulans]|nr:group-specific protein [Niallia circulans]
MKRTTWRSYSILVISVLLILNILLLDFVSQYVNQFMLNLYGSFIPLSIITIFVLAVICFSSKTENKVIPVLASLIAFAGIAIIIFFIYFGANFAN